MRPNERVSERMRERERDMYSYVQGGLDSVLVCVLVIVCLRGYVFICLSVSDREKD
jgi:hypothetical protein